MAGEQCFRERQGKGGEIESDLVLLSKAHQLPERRANTETSPVPPKVSVMAVGERKFSTPTSAHYGSQKEDCSLVVPHFHGKSTQYCSLFPNRLV